MANFPNTQCDLEKFFKEHTIVINLTFCGDWAGAVYGQMGCPGTCVGAYRTPIGIIVADRTSTRRPCQQQS